MYSKGYENSIQNENFIQIKMSHLKCVIWKNEKSHILDLLKIFREIASLDGWVDNLQEKIHVTSGTV